MIKNGQIVYFKRAKRTTARREPEIEFKGQGFGVFLGHVPPFAQEPQKTDLLRMMGTIGFMSFDDIGEFFGPLIGVEAVKKFENKYYSPVVVPEEEQPVTPENPNEIIIPALGDKLLSMKPTPGKIILLEDHKK